MEPCKQTCVLFVSDNENCSMEFVTLMNALGPYECAAASWIDAWIHLTQKKMKFLSLIVVTIFPYHLLRNCLRSAGAKAFPWWRCYQIRLQK